MPLTNSLASSRHLLGAAVLLIIVFAASLGLFELLWRRSALEDITKQPAGWVGAVIVVICSAVVHELLHGFGWKVFARASWQSIASSRTGT